MTARCWSSRHCLRRRGRTGTRRSRFILKSIYKIAKKNRFDIWYTGACPEYKFGEGLAPQKSFGRLQWTNVSAVPKKGIVSYSGSFRRGLSPVFKPPPGPPLGTPTKTSPKRLSKEAFVCCLFLRRSSLV